MAMGVSVHQAKRDKGYSVCSEEKDEVVVVHSGLNRVIHSNECHSNIFRLECRNA